MKKLIVCFASITVTLVFNFNAHASIKPAKIISRKSDYAVSELKKNIEYDYAKASIRILYDDRLDQLAKLVKDKDYVIALRGHADKIGTFKGNWVLSQKRADAVKLYLVSKGVPEEKIVTTAYGSTIPVAPNSTAAGRQKNRRVEIKINGNIDN
jgi:outer membrane protein OmpA-like peptidoglycan-associated protein